MKGVKVTKMSEEERQAFLAKREADKAHAQESHERFVQLNHGRGVNWQFIPRLGFSNFCPAYWREASKYGYTGPIEGGVTCLKGACPLQKFVECKGLGYCNISDTEEQWDNVQAYLADQIDKELVDELPFYMGNWHNHVKVQNRDAAKKVKSHFTRKYRV